MQGMIAEYERAKILERSRRGKMHAARNGSVSVFSKAPYGYRYISKREGHGVARFEVIASEAQTLMTIFEWYGKEDYSLIQICERLNREGVLRRSGKPGWDPTSVWDMLKDTASKGEALYGKSHVGEYRPHLRPAHGQPEYLPLVLALLVIDHDDHVPLGHRLECLFDLREFVGHPHDLNTAPAAGSIPAHLGGRHPGGETDRSPKSHPDSL